MKVIRWLDKNFEEVVMIGLIILICIVMFIQIILRLCGNALPWAEELCRFLFVWFACMGFATGVKHQEDLRVDTLYNKVPASIRKVFNIVTAVCMFVFCAVFLYGGVIVLEQQISMGAVSSSLRLPMWIVAIALLIGIILMVFRMIQNFARKQRV